MGLRTCSLLLLFFLSVSLSAQDPLFTSRAAGEARITFREQSPSIHQNSNAILIKLAAARDESPRRLWIGVTYIEGLEVKALAMKSPEVTIRCTAVKSFRAPSYREFTMEEVLTPDLMTCYLNLIDLPDSNILRQFKLTNLEVTQLSAGYTSSDIPVVEPGKFSVTLSDITFYYSDAALEKFRARIQLVNDYYAAAALTDSLLEATQSYDPISTNDLPEKYIQLMEINRILKLIGSRRFEEQLNLKTNDPVACARKFLKLDKFSRSATMTFEQQLGDPAPLRWKKSLTDLSETYINHLLSYIRKSMVMDGVRGGIYREYVDTYFLSTGFNHEEGAFHDLMRKMFPFEDPVAAGYKVSRVVWNAYLQAARQLIRESSYAAAILLLEQAGSFRKQIPLLDLQDYLPLQVEAVKGIYASYLGIAESCIDLQKFQMAENYISQAGAYLAEFEGVIPADTMFRRVFRKLFNRRLQECDRILDVRQYQEALDCYQQFTCSYPPEMIAYVEDRLASGRQQAWKGLLLKQRDQVFALMRQRDIDSALVCYDLACEYGKQISGNAQVIVALDELNSRMLPVRYEQLADRGTYLYMTYNHEEAFQTFKRMKEVGELLGMPLDTAMDRMYLESYKHHMLNEISMATGMIWKDELEMARAYAQEVESVMDLYNLEMDPDLQLALINYRRKIDLKICLGIKEDADMLAIRAHRNIELKQFDLAVKQLGEARQKVRQHPECNFDTPDFDHTINKYLSAAFYQEKLQQAQHEMVLGNYREAIQLVSDNELFYRNKQLERFGVLFTSALDFVFQSARVPMVLKAVPFFLQSGDLPAAWSCLTWLKRENVEARDIRELQETVGNALALRDFEIFPGGDPEERVRNYTGGSRWFLKFAQAYTGRWRQLQIEQSLKIP